MFQCLCVNNKGISCIHFSGNFLHSQLVSENTSLNGDDITQDEDIQCRP